MSKIGRWFIHTADDRADDDAREVRRLNHLIARARDTLSEGDPCEFLAQMQLVMLFLEQPEEAQGLHLLRQAIEATLAILERA